MHACIHIYMHAYIHTYIHIYIHTNSKKKTKNQKKTPSSFFFLQRMATILSWTLEINHLFVSMFGNTLAFSKLPLRDILSTQKDIMNNFLVIANDIYKYACKLNSDQQYKWHKNLQMTALGWWRWVRSLVQLFQ